MLRKWKNESPLSCKFHRGLIFLSSSVVRQWGVFPANLIILFPGSVDSNETLYGGDPKFLSEINKLCETLIGQILDHLKTLGRDEVRRRCFWFKFLMKKQKATASTAEWIILKKNNLVLVEIQISSLPKCGCCVTKVMLPSCTCGNENQKLENHADMHFPPSCSRAHAARALWPSPCLVSCWLTVIWGTTSWASWQSTFGTSATNMDTARPAPPWVHVSELWGPLYTLKICFICECSFSSSSAADSDSGVHQTSDSTAGHDSSVRYGPEAHAAVSHLSSTLNDVLHCSI